MKSTYKALKLSKNLPIMQCVGETVEIDTCLIAAKLHFVHRPHLAGSARPDD